MRLTLHADYGLRVLIYLATAPGRVVSTTDLGHAYGISKHHLVRVAHSLRDGGFIELATGRTGGLTLARPAAAIKIGDVVRALEPELRLVECFDAASNTCPISPRCALSAMIGDALAAFLAALDAFTLADVIARSGPSLPSYFIPASALRRPRTRTARGAVAASRSPARTRAAPAPPVAVKKRRDRPAR